MLEPELKRTVPPPAESRRPKLVTALIETFGFSPLLATIVALFLIGLGSAAVLWIFLSAPPRSITITSGPPDSSFQRNAERYKDELAKRGFTLHIRPSGGSSENLQRLQAKDSEVDVGFVQGGLVGDKPPPGLVSLGTVSYQPLWIFYRSPTPIVRLSELAGKRIGIGTSGSGVQTLAKAILQLNGLAGPPTVFVEHASERAGADLLAGKLDAIFLMGDSAPLATLRTLTRAENVQIYHFTQADAYVRKLPYLNKIILPQGSFEIGSNLPSKDVALVGPGIELIARDNFNSAAVVDLLLDVAKTVNGRPGLLAKRGEFPVPLEREFPLSDDALRFYKSGKGITYKLVGNFWLASLINRLIVAIVPITLVLIPAIRLLPLVYRWSVQLRIYRCYRPLLRLEREAEARATSTTNEELLSRLDAVEQEVGGLKVPASFAHQFYELRRHVAFVRKRIETKQA